MTAPQPQQQQPQMAGPPPAQQPQAAPRRPLPEDAASYITVSDPVQHQEGMQKFTSYRVDVRPNNNGQDIMPAGANNFSAVLRRYSDFLWLYERLQDERGGAIVPPLPEKQPVGRFSPQFVEERRMALERFIRRVAVHPELHDAPSLDVFLRADDHTFHAAKKAAKNGVNTGALSSMMQSTTMGGYPQQPQQIPMMPPTVANGGATKKEGFKRWFAETKTSLSGDLVSSPDDALFEEINRYIHGLDTQLKSVSQQASGLVRKGKEMANGLFEFGLAMNLLGQSEADALGEALAQVGATADRLSVVSADQAEAERVQFDDPIADTLKIIHAVKLALHRRHEKRITYSTCCATVDAKQAAVLKYRAQLGSDAKAYAAEQSLRRAQENANIARESFTEVSQRVLREVDRFQRDQADDLRRTVLDYIRLQVDYHKRMEQAWAALIPTLEQVQLDQNANVVGAGAGNGPSLTVAPPQQQQQPQQPMYQPQQQQPMGGVLPNPQQPGMMQPPMQQQMPPPQQHQMPNPFQSQQQQQQQSVPPPQHVPPPGSDPMLSVQYREAPSGAF